MGVIVTKDNSKDDDLSRRIDADLRTKMSGTGVIEGDTPDLVDDMDYMTDYKKTGKYGWVWILLVIFAIIALIIIFTP